MCIILLTLATSLIAVHCEEIGGTLESQLDSYNINYVANPVQSFTIDDRRAQHTPYGFYYGLPVSHYQYMDNLYSDQQQFQLSQHLQQPQQAPKQQQMKVKKDIREVNSGNSLVLDDIRNDLLNIKDNLATLALSQKNVLNNNVNQKLATIRFPSHRKLFGHLNQYPTGATFAIDDGDRNVNNEHMDNSETNDIVSSQYQRESNYGNGAEYAVPPLPNLPYGLDQYDYSNVKTKKNNVIGGKKDGKKNSPPLKAKLKDAAVRQAVRRANALQRHAQRTMAFIRNGVVNALWTALVVACVKLTPLMLYGAKLLFQSVIPLAGMAVFHNRRGLFADAEQRDDDEQRFNDDDTDDENNDDGKSKKDYSRYY